MSHHVATVTPQSSVEAEVAIPIPARSSGRSRVMRRVAALALAIAAPLGLGVATATPAHAASYLSGCFRSPTPGMGFTGTPAKLQYWNGAQWAFTGYSTPIDRNGCAAFNIGSSLRPYYLKLVVSERVGSAFFFGATPYYASPGNLQYNLGTGYVYCTGCS